MEIIRFDEKNRRYDVKCGVGHFFHIVKRDLWSIECPQCKEEAAQKELLLSIESATFKSRGEAWDQDFIAMAKWWAERKSKDPSTKTGAVITRGREVVMLGYNGFAKGVKDLPERYADRELKYKLIVHCERNAIILAKQDLTGCTLYTWPFMSCSVCASLVIQAGITRCVAPPVPEHLKGRWEEDMKLAEMQFEEAGVKLDIVDFAG